MVSTRAEVEGNAFFPGAEAFTRHFEHVTAALHHQVKNL